MQRHLPAVRRLLAGLLAHLPDSAVARGGGRAHFLLLPSPLPPSRSKPISLQCHLKVHIEIHLYYAAQSTAKGVAGGDNNYGDGALYALISNNVGGRPSVLPPPRPSINPPPPFSSPLAPQTKKISRDAERRAHEQVGPAGAAGQRKQPRAHRLDRRPRRVLSICLSGCRSHVCPFSSYPVCCRPHVQLLSSLPRPLSALPANPFPPMPLRILK